MILADVYDVGFQMACLQADSVLSVKHVPPPRMPVAKR